MAGFDMTGLFDATRRQVSDLFGSQDASLGTPEGGAFADYLSQRAGMGSGAPSFMARVGDSGMSADSFMSRLANSDQASGSFMGRLAANDAPFDPYATANTLEAQWQAKQAQQAAEKQSTPGTGREATLSRSSSAPAGLPTDQWRGLIEQAAKEQGVDPDVLEAIMMLESSGDPKSQSAAGAMGLMQVMPFHFRAGEDPWDPATNIRVGARVFADGYKRFGSYDKAAAAYLGAIDANGNITTDKDAYGTDGFAYVNKFNTNLNLVKQKRQAAASAGLSNMSNAGGVFPVVGWSGTVEKHWGESTGAADIFASPGTAIRAIKGGQVVSAGWSDIGGWNVTIVDPQSGLTFYYAHMQNQPNVSTGQTVAGGTVIGGVGDTGNAKGTGAHLHLGIGPSIQSGSGPNGGAGINPDGSPFNATAYLNSLVGH